MNITRAVIADNPDAFVELGVSSLVGGALLYILHSSSRHSSALRRQEAKRRVGIQVLGSSSLNPLSRRRRLTVDYQGLSNSDVTSLKNSRWMRDFIKCRVCPIYAASYHTMNRSSVMFYRADADKDGKVSRYEFVKYFCEIKSEMAFNKSLQKDNEVSREDVDRTSIANLIFDEFDFDDSGFLDYEEFSQWVDKFTADIVAGIKFVE